MAKALIRRSTDDTMSEALRIRGWRDALHEAVLEMDPRPDRPLGFFGVIEQYPLERLIPHQAQGSAQKITRNDIEIRRSARNAYYLMSQPRLPWCVSQAGQVNYLEPGETVLIDSRVPYSFHYGAGLDDLVIELPIDWVERWLPKPDDVIGRPLQGKEGWGLALRGVKEALVPNRMAGLGVDATLLEDQVGVLLALASGSLAPVSSGRTDLWKCCTAVIRSRFSEPGLSAADVAAECSISLRTLHRVFAGRAQTFLSTLMHERTAAAARMLGDRRFRNLTTAEIGRRCGFPDPSHFARQFRDHRQCTPLQYRVAALD